MSDVREEDTVTLIASDGTKCAIIKKAAIISPVLKAMIQGPIQEKDEVTLPDIGPDVLDKVVEYLELKCRSVREGGDNDETAIAQFKVPPEMSLELLLAADYLNV